MRLHSLAASWLAGYPAKGPGFFVQDVDLKAMRMETIRPFIGKIKGMDTNLTMLTLGWEVSCVCEFVEFQSGAES